MRPVDAVISVGVFASSAAWALTRRGYVWPHVTRAARGCVSHFAANATRAGTSEDVFCEPAGRSARRHVL